MEEAEQQKSRGDGALLGCVQEGASCHQRPEPALHTAQEAPGSCSG